jgi:CDP-diacylglycerol--glycerol-3-phosphate 3-phosphatidyltransferase
VSKAIQDEVHLFQVLPSPLDTILPNPLNEVAGVFHIKLYIIDDHLIISGANLSEEYFKDRQDRYLWICKGGNGLVDFYAQLFTLLCRRAYTYQFHDDNDKEVINPPKTTSHSEFLQSLALRFQDTSPKSAKELLTATNETVAVGVPTIFVPSSSLLSWSFSSSSSSLFVTDTESTLGLLEEGAEHHDRLQLSSAYLNPTNDMMKVIRHYKKVQLLTAGHISHGFRPKKKAGNKGKKWIPTVFDHLADDTLKSLKYDDISSNATESALYHWERDGWTFHAKGIWLREDDTNRDIGQINQGQVAAAIVGSSNFGERSFVRDMESNLSLILVPDDESLQGKTMINVAQSLGDDWDTLMASSRLIFNPKNSKDAPPLPLIIRWMFPFIKSYF